MRFDKCFFFFGRMRVGKFEVTLGDFYIRNITVFLSTANREKEKEKKKMKENEKPKKERRELMRNTKNEFFTSYRYSSSRPLSSIFLSLTLLICLSFTAAKEGKKAQVLTIVM